MRQQFYLEQYQSGNFNSIQPAYFEQNFQQWAAAHESRIYSQYQAIKSPLPFEIWKMQQRRDRFSPQRFVHLNAIQRWNYRMECGNGLLLRCNIDTLKEENANRKLPVVSTCLEETVHSGRGWMIFVIGPHNDLYCASHVKDIFNHSSFFSDSLVMAAGEIKTDNTGKIVAISGKSGHYKPTHRENVQTLRWFQVHRTNLNQVSFSYFNSNGSLAPPMNAQQYLNLHG